MNLEIVRIDDGEIEFLLNDVNHTVEYWLDFSHSEGEQTLDPREYSYIEYHDLVFSEEVLIELERYEEFKPTNDVYAHLRKAIQNKNFDIQVI